jgi:hypothetical protein
MPILKAMAKAKLAISIALISRPTDRWLRPANQSRCLSSAQGSSRRHFNRSFLIVYKVAAIAPDLRPHRSPIWILRMISSPVESDLIGDTSHVCSCANILQ